MAWHPLFQDQPNRLVGDALDHAHLDQTISQQLHRPRGASLGWRRTGHRDERRFSPTVQPSRLPGSWSFLKCGIQTFGDEQVARAIHRVGMDIQEIRNAGRRHALVRV